MTRELVSALAVTLALSGCADGSSRSYAGTFDPLAFAPKPSSTAKPFTRLAVTEYSGAVKIFNGSYQLTSTITQGLVHPLDDTYDSKGNLYVGNCVSGSCDEGQGPDVVAVNEYNPSGKEIYSYSHGLVIPGGIAVDKDGDVFVADGGLTYLSSIFEYKQQHQTPIAKCFTGLYNGGLHVDDAGNVFVAGDSSLRGGGYLREYVHGLPGCTPRVPRITLGSAGGLTLDREHNIVVCDDLVGVDIIPPPYNSIKSTIDLMSQSDNVALDRANDLIFIVNEIGGQLLVATYPQGDLVRDLSKEVSEPLSVATYP
jgi:DNA-binding beta-propeller fold protein YncE